MSLVRWDPFANLDDMFSRMPGLVGRWPRWVGNGGGAAVEWSPSVDISETDSEYLLKAQLPAVKKEDVQVTIDNGVITIKGERKQQKEEKNEKYHRVESFYGTFERSFSLPEDVNTDSIKCESKEGILTVHIPKAALKKSKPVQIAVQ